MKFITSTVVQPDVNLDPEEMFSVAHGHRQGIRGYLRGTGHILGFIIIMQSHAVLFRKHLK